MPADGAASRATKLVFPLSRSEPVMVPTVQSPIGLVQFCVVNTLLIVPHTGRQRLWAETLKVESGCFVGNTTADSPKPRITSKTSLLTCFICISPLLKFLNFFETPEFGSLPSRILNSRGSAIRRKVLLRNRIFLETMFCLLCLRWCQLLSTERAVLEARRCPSY